MSIDVFLELEVVKELLEEEMLVGLSNHWLMMMWMIGSSGCHGGLWWLIENKEDDEMVTPRNALPNDLNPPLSSLCICCEEKFMILFRISGNVGESDEFVLNHEGDKNDARVIFLKTGLTIKVQNKTRDNWLINFIETIEKYVRKTMIDVIRCVVKLINNSTPMNASIFDRFVEGCDSRRNTGCLGYFGNVRTDGLEVEALVDFMEVVEVDDSE
nr:hypothetical protein [Tanacetum cinerariifolium]